MTDNFTIEQLAQFINDINKNPEMSAVKIKFSTTRTIADIVGGVTVEAEITPQSSSRRGRVDPNTDAAETEV